MNHCRVKGCPHPAMTGARYCANHAPYHGACPCCNRHYTSIVDRAYVMDMGMCSTCASQWHAWRKYAHRVAEQVS